MPKKLPTKDEIGPANRQLLTKAQMRRAEYLSEVRANGGDIYLALESMGVPERTMRSWKERITGFTQALMDAKELGQAEYLEKHASRLRRINEKKIFEDDNEKFQLAAIKSVLPEYQRHDRRTVEVKGKVEHEHTGSLSVEERKRLFEDAQEAIEVPYEPVE